MSNSTLVSYKKLSPNHSGARKYEITRITPHCVVGQLSVETLGSIFAPKSRQASCNYGIGSDGRVGMYCEEKNRSWCSSSSDNDNRAVTIECASDLRHPYAFNDKVYSKLVDLCVDICKRNGKTKLLWLGDKNKTLSYKPKADEMVLTAHRWFASTACPGDWFYSREGDLAKRVTEKLSGTSKAASPAKKTTTAKKSSDISVRVSISNLNIRKGPGTSYARTGEFTGKGIFTITEIKKGTGSNSGWGKLKSGAGWISMDWAKKV